MRSIQLQKKKGMSIGDMYPAVLTILMIGIVLGVGLFILSTFHDTIATVYTGAQDSINTSTGTTTLTDAALTNFNMSVLAVINDTGGGTLTNFTYTGAGVITWGADIVAAGDALVNTTYTYIYDATSSPEEALTTTISGIATFADWIAIIVVVIAAAIVLGIVLTSFGGRRNMI